LGAFATVTAFEQGEPWLDDVIVQLDHNRKLIGDLIAANTPEVRYRIPHCSYLAWLDLTSFNLGEDPSAVLVEKAKVAFVPGHRFGAQSAQFVRLNFATSHEILEEAFNRLATFLH
jgi:cystathionine beta-lyase